MPTQQPTLSPPPDISSVEPTRKERALSAIGGFISGGSGASMSKIDQGIQREQEGRLAQARMYRQLAATIASQLATGFDAKTGAPITPEQEQELQHQYEAAWSAYEKAAGVSKDTKGALQRAKAIVEHFIGIGRQRRQEQGQPQGGTPLAGGTAPAQGAAPAAGGMQPPPKFDVNQAALQEPVRRAGVEEGLAEQIGERRERAAVALREEFAKKANLQPGSLGYQEYTLTGKFPAQAHLQKAMFKRPPTPDNPNPAPEDGSYDPSSGQYVDQKGQPVDGALPVNTAMLTPHPFKYLSEGKLLPGFQVGTQYYDMEMKPLPAGTELYMRGLFGTDTLHQQITYDPQGNPQINTLERVSTPIIPGRGRGGAGATGPAAPAGGATPKAPGGGMTPPPSVGGVPRAQGRISTPVAGVDALGRPLGMSASAQRQQAQKVTAVKEGVSQIFGDPSNPGLKPLKDFGYLAADKESQKRIAKAWQIIVDESGIEEPEKSGKTMTLIQAYTGFPQALAGALTRVKQQVQNEMRPDELEALDATVTAFSTAVALRSLTSASAAQFSVRALERDVPIIGLTAINEQQFNDKLSRLGELANNGLKVLPDSFFQAPETKEALRQRMGIHAPTDTKAAAPPTKKGGMKPPPKGKESPQEEMRRLVDQAAPPGRP